MSSQGKIRLTELLVARGLCATPDEAERRVRAGEVHSADSLLTQPGLLVDATQELALKAPRTYVSRGGDKLAGALAEFTSGKSPCGFTPQGLFCLDVGASTGGFTDCLLQAGAASVVAVDVAYGQFAWQLRTDPRVTVIERTNIRDVEPSSVGAPFDLIVADVSFTPLGSLLPHLVRFLLPGGALIALVKPQFELKGVSPSLVGKGGVVTDPSAHVHALELALKAAQDNDLAPLAASFSTLKGPKGNIEFFLFARRGYIPAIIDVCAIVTNAHKRLD